jgi:hypothetical protein
MDSTTVNVICGLIRDQAAVSAFGCSLDWAAPAAARRNQIIAFCARRELHWDENDPFIQEMIQKGKTQGADWEAIDAVIGVMEEIASPAKKPLPTLDQAPTSKTRTVCGGRFFSEHLGP